MAELFTLYGRGDHDGDFVYRQGRGWDEIKSHLCRGGLHKVVPHSPERFVFGKKYSISLYDAPHQNAEPFYINGSYFNGYRCSHTDGFPYKFSSVILPHFFVIVVTRLAPQILPKENKTTKVWARVRSNNS